MKGRDSITEGAMVAETLLEATPGLSRVEQAELAINVVIYPITAAFCRGDRSQEVLEKLIAASKAISTLLDKKDDLNPGMIFRLSTVLEGEKAHDLPEVQRAVSQTIEKAMQKWEAQAIGELKTAERAAEMRDFARSAVHLNRATQIGKLFVDLAKRDIGVPLKEFALDAMRRIKRETDEMHERACQRYEISQSAASGETVSAPAFSKRPVPALPTPRLGPHGGRKRKAKVAR